MWGYAWQWLAFNGAVVAALALSVLIWMRPRLIWPAGFAVAATLLFAGIAAVYYAEWACGIDMDRANEESIDACLRSLPLLRVFAQ